MTQPFLAALYTVPYLGHEIWTAVRCQYGFLEGFKKKRMAYSVAAAQPSDAYDIATIMLDSFKDDPIISQLWPNTDPEANHAWHVRYYTKAFGTVGRDGTHFLKVVDNESGYVKNSLPQK